jgi:hypothetical protein
MKRQPLNIVILGLSVTSSWGNGHATTYRGLIRGLAARGHRILFLERDVPWYAGNRDQPAMPEGGDPLSHGREGRSAEPEAERLTRRSAEHQVSLLRLLGRGDARTLGDSSPTPFRSPASAA